MEMAYDEAFEYDWTRGGLNLLADTSAQYEAHMFPLSVIGRGGWELPNWVQGYEAYWRDKAAAAQASGDARGGRDCGSATPMMRRPFGEHLKGITEQYQIAYIELDRDLAVDKVCDIFTQINSKGIRLDVFDLINALLKPKGLQLKHMWREAAPRLDFVETERMNVYILQVMSILRQAYCSPKYLYYLLPGQEKIVRDPDGSLRKEVLVQDIADFETRWDTAVDALRKAIELLRHPQEFGAISSAVPAVRLDPARLRGAAGRRRRRSRRTDSSTPSARSATGIGRASSRTATRARSSRPLPATSSMSRRGSTTMTKEPALLAEFRQRFRDLELRKEVQARHVGLQRDLQPARAPRRPRLDDRQRPAVRRSGRPPHRPQGLAARTTRRSATSSTRSSTARRSRRTRTATSSATASRTRTCRS